MKIETITYKRVKNLGNYQSETMEATATVDEGENAHLCAERLKEFVCRELCLLGKDEEEELSEGF